MKALIAFGMLLMTAGVANAGGLVTKHSSSVQLNVDAARSTAVRMGSSYSTSGTGVVTDVGGSGTADLNVGSLTVSSGVGAFGGGVTATQAMTLTAGGAGSSATGQFVSEITVID